MHRRRFGMVIAIVLLGVMFVSPAPTRASDWQIEVANDTLIQIRHKRSVVVKFVYHHWGKNWQHASARLKREGFRNGESSFKGNIGDLGVKVAGTIQSTQPNQLAVAYRLNATRSLSGIIGGGLEWVIDLDSPTFDGRSVNAPTLLEDSRGWEWQVGDGQSVRVEFSKPLANLYFEKGRNDVIRTFMLGSDVARGTQTFQMKVTLPDGGRFTLPVDEQYPQDDPNDWPKELLLWNRSPVDLSYLNHKPAGKHGFVKVVGDAFQFENGQPARFWGGNIAAQALFCSKEEIDEQATRIAQLGYNLMRLHHHDSTRWVKPMTLIADGPTSREFNPTALDRLDYWVHRLKEEGVYVWLDLHVGRQIREGDVHSPFGEIKGYDEIKKRNSELHGFSYYSDPIQRLMHEFNYRYLNHVNPYTGLAYKDEPAVMGLLITNENDLTHHFGNAMLADKGHPTYNQVFESLVDRFSQQTGIDRKKIGRTWLPGESKIFLNHLEYLFHRRMKAGLQQSIGVRVPVTTTNMWGGCPIYSLPAQSVGDMIDVHEYGVAEQLSDNPRYEDNSIPWVVAAQLYGKPLTITEWNVAYPQTDRFTAPMYMAAHACLQGWDAMMVYNYSQRPFHAPKWGYEWSTFCDPAFTSVAPAAAIAYREGHVQPAKKTYCLQLNRKNLYLEGLKPENSQTLRTLAEQSKLTIGLPDVPELSWDRETRVPEDVIVIDDPHKDFIQEGEDEVVSDTGEITRNWEEGILTINTPLTQSVSGWIGGKVCKLRDIGMQISNAKAAIVVTSMDRRPIGEAQTVLITTTARAIVPEGSHHYRSEPVTGTLVVRGMPGLKLVALGPAGKEHAVPYNYQDGFYILELNKPVSTHWYVLKPR